MRSQLDILVEHCMQNIDNMDELGGAEDHVQYIQVLSIVQAKIAERVRIATSELDYRRTT